jgi:hypothetical protein
MIFPTTHSQIKLPTEQQPDTMPTNKQIEVIRLQQAAVVTNLVDAPPVYTEMTQQEFNTKLKNLDRISTLCTRSIRATRHG